MGHAENSTLGLPPSVYLLGQEDVMGRNKDKGRTQEKKKPLRSKKEKRKAKREKHHGPNEMPATE
jgi:hypothetical protein